MFNNIGNKERLEWTFCGTLEKPKSFYKTLTIQFCTFLNTEVIHFQMSSQARASKDIHLLLEFYNLYYK
jgi:hypothetical protein